MGPKFEQQLEGIFQLEGELLQRHPELENGTRPDFLVEDEEGNRCYVEAKVRHNSSEEDSYFADWIVGTLMDHKSVDGKGVGIHGVSGIPESKPEVGRLFRDIHNWLAAFSLKDLEELEDRELRAKVFSLPGAEIKLVATRAHNTRGKREGQHVQIIRGDGNATYAPTVLGKGWKEYRGKRPDEFI